MRAHVRQAPALIAIAVLETACGPWETLPAEVRGAPLVREEVVRLQRMTEGKMGPTPCHSNYRVRWGACGKAPVMPQNSPPRPRTCGKGADELLRVGFPGDRPDAGRGRWRQGRAPGGAFSDRRPPRAG